jgi:hypothetical protein
VLLGAVQDRGREPNLTSRLCAAVACPDISHVCCVFGKSSVPSFSLKARLRGSRRAIPRSDGSVGTITAHMDTMAEIPVATFIIRTSGTATIAPGLPEGRRL